MTIYIAKTETGTAAKIGFTKQPAKRIRELQTGQAEALLIVRLLEGGRADELTIHRRFAELRLTGEWFRFSEEMLTANFGLADLPPPPPPRPKQPKPPRQKKPPGRPRLGDEPLTKAERDKRHLAAKAEKLAALKTALRQIADGHPDWREIARKSLLP
jgi:hypothetical protein